MFGAAQTGSGKTLAFGIPMVTHILREFANDNGRAKKLLGLVLTPTRELAIQVFDCFAFARLCVCRA